MGKFVLLFALLMLAIFTSNIIIQGFFMALLIFAIYQHIKDDKKPVINQDQENEP